MRSAIRCTSFGERRKSKKTNREFSHSKCREGGGGLMKERDLCIPCKWRAWIIHSNKIMQSAWESRTWRPEVQKRSGIGDRDCCNIEKSTFYNSSESRLINSRESFVSQAHEKCIRNYWCTRVSDSQTSRKDVKSQRQNRDIFRRELQSSFYKCFLVFDRITTIKFYTRCKNARERTWQPIASFVELRRIGCGEMVQRTKRVSVGGERKRQGKRALKEMFAINRDDNGWPCNYDCHKIHNT